MSQRVNARLLILNNLPAFYRTGPFNSLVDAWRDRTGGEAMVAYQARRDPFRRQEWFYSADAEIPYRHVFISNRTVRVRGRVTYSPRFGASILTRFRPTHMLVAGWDTPMSLAAATYRRASATTLSLWVESNSSTTRRTGALSVAYRRSVLRSADCVLVPTRASSEYVNSTSQRNMSILELPNPVMLDRLGETRSGDDKRLIFLGDFSRRKGFDVFAEAVRLGQSAGWRGHAWGTDTEGLASVVPPNCKVTTGLPLSEIIPMLSSRDVWLIPSRVDPAPLTFSEAMALGLRVVVSDAVAYAATIEGDGVGASRDEDSQNLLDVAARLYRSRRPDEAASRRFTADYWGTAVADFLLRR